MFGAFAWIDTLRIGAMEYRHCTSHLVTCLISLGHSSGDNGICGSFFSGIGLTSDCTLEHSYDTECEARRLRVLRFVVR